MLYILHVCQCCFFLLQLNTAWALVTARTSRMQTPLDLARKHGQDLNKSIGFLLGDPGVGCILYLSLFVSDFWKNILGLYGHVYKQVCTENGLMWFNMVLQVWSSICSVSKGKFVDGHNSTHWVRQLSQPRIAVCCSGSGCRCWILRPYLVGCCLGAWKPTTSRGMEVGEVYKHISLIYRSKIVEEPFNVFGAIDLLLFRI